MDEARIRIDWVDGAIAIRSGDPRRRLRLAAKLRRSFGGLVSARRNGYIVAAEGARYLTDLLGDPGVEWDSEARRRVQSEQDRLERQLAARAEITAPNGSTDLASLVLGVELDKHQEEAALAIAAPSAEGFALFDEGGTGKTLSALAGFALLRARGVVDRVLVVAPKSVLGSWCDEAARLLGPSAQISLAAGVARQRRRAMRAKHDVLITNCEGAVAEEALLDVVLRGGARYLLVIVESYLAKNPGRRRSSTLLRLRRRCVRAVVLCGTPAPNAPWDLVNQLNLADGGTVFGPAVQPADPDEARRRVAVGLERSLHLRRLKPDVLPALPAQRFEAALVKMQPTQVAMYVAAASKLALELRSITDEAFSRNLATYMARRTALLQICSHPGGIDPLYQETPGKILSLDRLLHEFIVGRAEKVVVWSWYRYSLQYIASRYGDYGVARIDGSVTSASVRTATIAQFQKDPQRRLFVGNPGAAGAGITLTAAAVAIYESLSNQASHYLQSVDRIHRRGQRRDVRHMILLCEGTVEEDEYERLLRKQSDARDLLGDRYREPPTRVALLEEVERSFAHESPS